jgi:hypothetical protein
MNMKHPETMCGQNEKILVLNLEVHMLTTTI